MRLEIQPREQIATRLGYLNDNGQLSQRAVAGLLRAPLERWGLSPKRSVLGYARAQLRAVGLDGADEVSRVLKRLIALGECEEVYVTGQPYIAPAAPRWISTGGGYATYLGVSRAHRDVEVLDGAHDDIVQRLRIDEDAAAVLESSGAREISLLEWLAPLAYLEHTSRRLGEVALSSQASLRELWAALEKTLLEEGLPLGDDANVRFVAGRPGDFFGRHGATRPEGRWTETSADGLWCAYRRGYNDNHWNPCIVSVTADERRVLDLYDRDEWEWAVLARGKHTGMEERPRSVDGEITLTSPPPAQIRAALDILGPPTGAWSWDLSASDTNLWELLG